MPERALGLYVHWPYCAAICPYCDFNVYKARGRDAGPLLDAIVADLEGWRASLGPRPLASLFLGGGTPSLLTGAEVGRLIEAADRLFGFEPGAELCLEANPTDAEAARFADFARAGIERLSLGVQALDDASLKTLGRFHSAAEGVAAARLAREVFPRLSIDLIHSRHGQSLADWDDELGRALALAPDHVSPYLLTIEAGTAYERAARRGTIRTPADEDAAAFLTLTRDRLEASGFDAYEVSNHARTPAARSRHNLIYWTSQDWIGIGPGAHGRIGFGADRRATRAALRPEAYVAQVRATGRGVDEVEALDLEAARDEFWLMGLRLDDGAPVGEAPGAPLDAGRVAEVIEAGLGWSRDGRIGLTPAGRLVADGVIARLL